MAHTRISHKLCKKVGQTVFSRFQSISAGKVLKPFQGNRLEYSGKQMLQTFPESCEKSGLDGTLTQVDCKILKSLIRQIKFLTKEILSIEADIGEAEKEMQAQVTQLITIPGVDEMSACTILGEIGTDMTCFPTAGHLTSWACICPGNHESAGKQYNTSIRKGCNYLKSLLMQIAWAASRTNTYLGTKHRQMVARKGKKKALVAIARKILIMCYYMLQTGQLYHELGIDFLDKLKGKSKAKYYLTRLKQARIPGLHRSNKSL